MQILTRSVHGKFNCITIKYNGTRHSIYIIGELHSKFNILLMEIEKLYDAKQVKLNSIFN